ncbi:killer cell lectin-like receptor subfamily E member 1 isoform X1 [Meriones unguiculatus]|uniref:killer cell lectin-like receptor subfamily E member 1 isoform X1 n=1 Tax=Meriones unguiculatus TaxID=10047 RepID=UPI00293E3FA8|nr:killer cell lectin-like receptor subfamily E member 1 isoform X1 [Meriones unguiculatus]XP_060240271.1 killer cell lectin-like receptor subfamily E member 1 isoform X1 [Meriones unguiculatus]
MNEAPITHSNLNVNSQQKCKAKKNIKNTFSSNELSFIEQKHQKRLKKHKNIGDDITAEESFSPSPWRLISSVLGVTCLLLMAATIVVTIFTTNSSSERTSSTIQQKGPHHPCLEDWVWFRCSCYYFSQEKLSWRESQRACLSLNSSLLRMEREEMDFFTLKSFFWVGVYYNETNKQWLWENHSVLPFEMFYDLQIYMKYSCASYKSKEAYLSENCTTKLPYVCKKYHF